MVQSEILWHRHLAAKDLPLSTLGCPDVKSPMLCCCCYIIPQCKLVQTSLLHTRAHSTPRHINLL